MRAWDHRALVAFSLGCALAAGCGSRSLGAAEDESTGEDTSDTGRPTSSVGTATTGGPTSSGDTGPATSSGTAPEPGSTGSSESGDESSSSTTGPVDPGGPAGPGWEECVGIEEETCTLGGDCLQNMYVTVGACSVPCRTDDDCPAVEGGTAVPTCTEFNFGTDACTLDCANGEVCPEGMFCYSDSCSYLAEPIGDGQCPDEQLQGGPHSIIGTTLDMGDDVVPSCWFSYEDVAYEYTAEQSGWHYFDAEESATAVTLTAANTCGGDPIACRTGFAQFIAEFWLDLDAGQTILLGVDGSGGYRLDVEFIGNVPDGHCCFGSFEGCSDDTVRECVCGLSPGCCNNWDAQCAVLAEFSCNADCG